MVRDHNFSPEEKDEYDHLTARGRAYYDEVRWVTGDDHSTAYTAAVLRYGVKLFSPDYPYFPEPSPHLMLDCPLYPSICSNCR